MTCTIESRTHSYALVREPFWRDVIHYGRKMFARMLTLQCDHCGYVKQIETFCGRGPLIVGQSQDEARGW